MPCLLLVLWATFCRRHVPVLCLSGDRAFCYYRALRFSILYVRYPAGYCPLHKLQRGVKCLDAVGDLEGVDCRKHVVWVPSRARHKVWSKLVEEGSEAAPDPVLLYWINYRPLLR